MKTATQNSLHKLLVFLDRLEQANISYRLDHIRESLMVEIAVPGERWEVEFFEDDHVEVERFVSTGTIEGEDMFDKLFIEHSDK